MLKYIKLLQSQNPDGTQKSNLLGWHSQDFDLEQNLSAQYLISH